MQGIVHQKISKNAQIRQIMNLQSLLTQFNRENKFLNRQVLQLLHENKELKLDKIKGNLINSFDSRKKQYTSTQKVQKTNKNHKNRFSYLDHSDENHHYKRKERISTKKQEKCVENQQIVKSQPKKKEIVQEEVIIAEKNIIKPQEKILHAQQSEKQFSFKQKSESIDHQFPQPPPQQIQKQQSKVNIILQQTISQVEAHTIKKPVRLDESHVRSSMPVFVRAVIKRPHSLNPSNPISFSSNSEAKFKLMTQPAPPVRYESNSLGKRKKKIEVTTAQVFKKKTNYVRTQGTS